MEFQFLQNVQKWGFKNIWDWKFLARNPPLFRNTLKQGGFLAWITPDLFFACKLSKIASSHFVQLF